MLVIDDLAKANLTRETILTIGAFDGVHRGHQALIGAVVERARATGRLAALITFYPHPAAIRAPERALRYLTMPGENLALLEALGLDLVALLPFDRALADTPARAFMERVAARLRLRELWVGADFHLGRDREGDVPCLRELGRELGYDITVFGPVFHGDQAVSSSRIRALLREGRIETAAALLGRNPSVTGKASLDSQARLEVEPERALPAAGVYAALAVLGGERVPALASVSVGPDGGQQTVGVHLLDSDREIQDGDVTVEFVSQLRGERPAENADDPGAHLEHDRRAARCILGRAGETARRYHFSELEHTADRALGVWGRELADLLVGAARGMYSLMGEVEGLVPEVRRTIRVEAGDREALLVEWLNELLYLSEQEGLLFTDFCIESVSEPAGGGTVALLATVGGAVGPVTGAHIKAATYHDLALIEDDAGWSTAITFDV